MNNNAMSIIIMLNYRPNGRRRLGRHLKTPLDEAEEVCYGLTHDG